MIFEILSAAIILGIAVFFLASASLTMPQGLQSMLILGLIISFLVFSAFIFKERASDERDSIHIRTAGRISYLVGVGGLVAGIIFQSLSHEIDPWLIIVLCAMIISKLLSRIYSHFRM